MKNESLKNLTDNSHSAYADTLKIISVLIGNLQEITYFLQQLEDSNIIYSTRVEDLLEFEEFYNFNTQANNFFAELKFNFPQIIRDFYEKEI